MNGILLFTVHLNQILSNLEGSIFYFITSTPILLETAGLHETNLPRTICLELFNLNLFCILTCISNIDIWCIKFL